MSESGDQIMEMPDAAEPVRSTTHGLGVSFELKRKFKQFRSRLFHRGLIDLGRFATSLEARLAYDQAVRSLSSLTGELIKPLNHPEHNEHISDVHEKVKRHLELLGSISSAGSTLASTVTVDTAAEPSSDSSSAFFVPDDPLLADCMAMAPVGTQQQAAAGAAMGALQGLTQAPLGSPLSFLEELPAQLPCAGAVQAPQAQGAICSLQQAVSPSASAAGSAARLQQVPAAFHGALSVSALQYGMQQQQQALCASVLQYEQQQQQHLQIWQGQMQQQQHTQMWQGQVQQQQQEQQQQEEDHQQWLEGFDLLPGAMSGIADAGIAAVLADFLAEDVPAPNSITRVPQQPLQHLGFSCSGHGRSTAAGAGVCAMDMPAELQQQQQGMQRPVVGDAAAASHGMQDAGSSSFAAIQQQQECEYMQSCSTQSAGAEAAACNEAAAGFSAAAAPCCGGPPLQLQGCGKPRFSTAGEFISFVDLAVVHLLQLYGRVTQPVQQHAGLTAVTWLVGVRSSITSTGTLSSSSSPGADCGAVPSAVLHTCVSLVSLAAGDTSTQADVQMSPDQQAREPFSCSFLAAVVEQLMQTLLTLRAVCAAASPSERPSSKALESFKAQLRAQANSAAAHAAGRLLDWL